MSEVQHGGRAGHFQKSPVCTLILFTLNYGKIINIYKSRESNSDYVWSNFHPLLTLGNFGPAR